MYILQLNQSNLLFTPFYVHKIRFISNKLHPSLTWPALWTSFSFLAPTNPKLLAYIDFIYFATMYILQLNQSNLLFTPFYVHKIRFISNKLHPSLTWPALWTSFSFLAPTNPKLLAYIDFIYFATMYILQLNQSNLLFTPFYVHKIQFISNKLHPSSSSHGHLCELVFLFLHQGSHFLKRHTRLFVVPYGQSDLSSSVF